MPLFRRRPHDPRARYAVVNLLEACGGNARTLSWRLMIHPDRITVGTLAAMLHDLGHELVLRAVPAGQPPAEEKPAPMPSPMPSVVPGVDADRLARYEALRAGPDANRVAAGLARDWRAVGDCLRAAMDLVRVDWSDAELGTPDEAPVLARAARRPRRYVRE